MQCGFFFIQHFFCSILCDKSKVTEAEKSHFIYILFEMCVSSTNCVGLVMCMQIYVRAPNTQNRWCVCDKSNDDNKITRARERREKRASTIQ